MRRIVVVGHGIAGLTAADSLRAAGYDGELTILGDEPHPAYSRPALSKALLRDDPTAHLLPPAAHGAVERLGVRVRRADLDRRVVTLTDGEEVPYDGLVVATGCRARRLGGPDSGEVTLRTLDDALALRARLTAQPRVVVVGGGPLGMELASSCLDAGCEVALVSHGPPLLAHLGRQLSQRFVRAALDRGLELHTTGPATVQRLPADLVVTAVGDVPNVEWLAGTGLVRHGAVPVDSRGRARPDVVAVGDVAAVPTRAGVRRVPLWHSAIDQARAAAVALLHGDAAPELAHRPYFWTEQFGLSLKAVGSLPGTGEPTWLEGGPDSEAALLRWPGPEAAVAALNVRIAIPRLRRLAESAA